jgi:predicted N-acetyltransferase YhbS
LNITIRKEQPDDYNTLLRLTYEAFLPVNYPGRRRMDEYFLLYLLRNSDSVISELCFVAEYEGEIIGHILYTKSKFKRLDGREVDTINFGPLSVLPKYQRQGIGKALVRYSLLRAKEMGYKAVLITGVPDYYPKLGFKRASTYNLVMV